MLRAFVAGSSLIALFFCSTRAQAEDDHARHPAQITLHGDPSVKMRIIGRNPTEPLAVCAGDCRFWALPGRYTVYTHDDTTGARRELSLRVNGFAEYHLVQGNDTVHDLGVGLEFTGATASVVGFLTMLYPFATPTCESNCKADNNGHIVVVGLGMLGAGLVTLAIGLELDTSNRSGFVLHDEWSEAKRITPSLRVGLVPVFAGLGVGGTVRF